jgi:adhesin transport system membrane fusion protein
MARRSSSNNLLLYAILLFVIIFIVWSGFARIDESVVAQGQVIASSKTQNIQSLDGGILERIFVKEGDVVNKGQALVKLNDIRYSSSYEENQVKYHALEARLIRLSAQEQDKDSIRFPVILNNDYPNLTQSETNLFYANIREFRATVSALNDNLKITRTQYNNFVELEAQQVIPRLELIKVKKELNDIAGKVAFAKNSYYSKVKDDITNAKTEFESLKEILSGYKDRLDRTLLNSPVYGVVKRVSLNTVGAIIKSGDTIIEIVPLDDELFVEGKILPNKIAFVDAGQEVNISITAYDPSVYGTLKGTITHIGSDTIIENDRSGKSQSFYKVVVKSNNTHIEYKGRKLPIIPGMQASVNIVTGERTVLQYILKPLIKTKLNAFNEQ